MAAATERVRWSLLSIQVARARLVNSVKRTATTSSILRSFGGARGGNHGAMTFHGGALPRGDRGYVGGGDTLEQFKSRHASLVSALSTPPEQRSEKELDALDSECSSMAFLAQVAWVGTWS